MSPLSEKSALDTFPRPAALNETMRLLPLTVAVGVPMKCALAANAVPARTPVATKPAKIARILLINRPPNSPALARQGKPQLGQKPQTHNDYATSPALYAASIARVEPA